MRRRASLALSRLSLLVLVAGLASCGDQPAGGAATSANNDLSSAANVTSVPDLPADNSFNESLGNNAVAPTRVADVVPDLPPERPRRAMTDRVEAPDNSSDSDLDEAPPFPDEVTRFMVQRDGCDHFLGEEPYDEERRAFLDKNIRELCTGTDRRLARLRKRYADNPDVIAALEKYEDVEVGSGS